MSKVGKKPVEIPEDVKVDINEGKITVNGPKGKLEKILPSEVSLEKKDNVLVVGFKGSKEKKALWGTWRSHIFNMLEGVKRGFEKRLKVEGVGWKAIIEGGNLVLNVGFSHPVKISPPEGISFSTEKNIIIVSGPDKELVGNVSAKIRKVRPPEPYKGKGVRYEDEVVRKKAGKKAVTALE